MTILLDLPTELIIQVFTSSSTVWTATCLSGANKELRSIWLKHSHQILKGIIRPQVPAYEDAVDLANLRISYRSKKPPKKAAQARPTYHPPAVLYFWSLLIDASRASEAADAWKESWNFKPEFGYEHDPAYIHPQRSYYLLRKLVLAYVQQDEKFKRALHSMLSAAPLVDLTANAELCNFLCSDLRDEDKIALDNHIQSPMNVFQFNDDFWGRCEPEWEYVGAVAKAALADRMLGTDTLEDAIFKPPHPREVADSNIRWGFA
jgi:hypothetical protein